MTNADTAVAVPTSRRRWQALSLLGVAIVVYALDQLSKNWVVDHLPEGQSVPVLGEFLQWHFVRNPGAAFSMASGATWIFTILAAAVVVVILWQLRKLGSRVWALFFALLLGGVLGNLTDRLVREPGFPVGHVIDFISTPWMLPAIYNVADIAIVVAMCLFALLVLLGVPIDGSPRRRSRDAHAEGTADGVHAAETNSDGASDDETGPDQASRSEAH